MKDFYGFDILTKIINSVNNLKESISNKQERIIGTAGQMVGFDATGNPVAQDMPEIGDGTRGLTEDEVVDLINDTLAEKPAIDIGAESFNGRTGEVQPESGDYTADMVGAMSKENPTFSGTLTSRWKDEPMIDDIIIGAHNYSYGGRTHVNGTCNSSTNFYLSAPIVNFDSENNQFTIGESDIVGSGYTTTTYHITSGTTGIIFPFVGGYYPRGYSITIQSIDNMPILSYICDEELPDSETLSKISGVVKGYFLITTIPDNVTIIPKGDVIGGVHNCHNGINSAIFGYRNWLAGNYLLANGSGNYGDAGGCSVSGSNNAIMGGNSIITGSYNYLYGSDCIVGGQRNKVGTGSGPSIVRSLVVGQNNEIVNNYGIFAGLYCKDEKGSNSNTDNLVVIGNGTVSAKSNAFRVTRGGAVYGLSAFNSTGADYSEFYEWIDANPNSEDRVGIFVTLDGKKIKPASDGDYILGVVSGLPCIIGNADEDWLGKYIRDEFGRLVTEEYEVDILDEEGNPTGETYTDLRYKLNPDYDGSQKYIERKDRPEWSTVGMLGVLSVKDDGTCTVNEYCKPSENGIATAADTYIPGQTYRVVNRVSENVVEIIFR